MMLECPPLYVLRLAVLAPSSLVTAPSQTLRSNLFRLLKQVLVTNSQPKRNSVVRPALATIPSGVGMDNQAFEMVEEVIRPFRLSFRLSSVMYG